ncbi:MAG: hypothetical protein COV10_03520 [Candidatus Vogelbacteria bacterium CG10_big_fil_rev_8_21_14_0_10_51_16]|uniref:Uncharacterized protein n=1 Tax=Candidatus Vogelbacteria bacterium CG10_big_fil_rev_8_21_14_0_10_51_16 TaxID=1975045 RepID=A0A2H0RDY0_9BACT|nr:MAG: hypothetical protein COV10_03520 [Candidatus Vogelbacteria bacterium CG10_big_fil_rev_8_21_14_0_10_51_16]
MFKEMLLKKMLASKLKGVPAEMQDKIIKLVSENPALFQKIASEAQILQKEKSLDQQSAMMQVAQKYKEELKGLFTN